MNEWQPIETAPAEGPVLVTWFHEGDGQWIQRNALMMCGQAYATDTPYSTQYRPSHWMPLPPPPSTPKQGEGE